MAKASNIMVENNSIFEEITAWISVKEAFQTLDLPVGADTTMVQINYHDQVLALEYDLADASEFASLREGITILALLFIHKTID